MKMILTKIKASNIYGKITREISKEEYDCAFDEAVHIIEDKYVKNLDNVKKIILPDYSATWESRTEYETGKHVGVKYKLELAESEELIF